jgi:alpha-D-xyloside xylohydrolase
MTPNMQDQDACSGAMDTGRKANIFDDPLAQDAWRRYARLHTRLFPYLYSLAHLAHETGAPIIRHLFLEHPDEPELRSEDASYYLGPSLLVSPVVTRGAINKTVYLPDTTYMDWDAQVVIDGGTSANLDAPLEKLPLLLRDGHLIPMLDPTIDTLAEESHSEVVGRTDVATTYDVVGFVTATTGEASFSLWNGFVFEVTWTGGLSAPSLPEAATEDELLTCGGCYLIEDLGGGLSRIRITSSDGTVTAGGLQVLKDVTRTIRWDLYLVE